MIKQKMLSVIQLVFFIGFWVSVATADEFQSPGSPQDIFTTPLGQEMQNKILESGKRVEVTFNDVGLNEVVPIIHYDDPKDHFRESSRSASFKIDVDLNVNYQVETTAGWIRATNVRIIAFLMGQAVFGSSEVGMVNIDLNENPIMRSLGEPVRIGTGGKL